MDHDNCTGLVNSLRQEASRLEMESCERKKENEDLCREISDLKVELLVLNQEKVVLNGIVAHFEGEATNSKKMLDGELTVSLLRRLVKEICFFKVVIMISHRILVE